MTPARRHGPATAVLMLAGFLCGACAAPSPDASLEAPTELRPAARETYLSLGNRLLAAKEPALAMKAFTRSITAEGLTPEALTGAGIAAQRQGLLSTARRYLVHARDMAPDSAIAHNNLGVVLLMLKDYDGARVAFRSALKLTGDENEEAIRRNLERAETALAARDEEAEADPAATQRVVRLGTSAFRLTEMPAETEAEPPIEDEAD